MTSEEIEEHISSIVDKLIERSGGDYKKLALIYEEIEQKQEKANGQYEDVFEEVKEQIAYIVTKLVIYHAKKENEN